MNDSLVDIYREQLKEATGDRGEILLRFYNSVFDTNFNGQILIQIRKLLKVYGTERVFFSILSAYDVEKFDPSKPYGMLAYFCKKSLEGVVIPDYIDIEKLKPKKHRVKYNDVTF